MYVYNKLLLVKQSHDSNGQQLAGRCTHVASLDTEERSTGQAQVREARKRNRASFVVSGVERAVVADAG